MDEKVEKVETLLQSDAQANSEPKASVDSDVQDGDSEKSEEKNRVFLVRDPGTRLRQLKCFPIIHKMIKSGKFLRDIALVIQIDHGEMCDVSAKALLFMLNQYKNYVYSEANVIDEPKKVGEGPDPDDPLYCLHSLRRRYQDIEQRVDMEKETEMGLQKLFSTTHKEYLTLLSVGMKIMDLNKKLGLLDADKKVRQQLSSSHGKTDLAQVIASPKSRQRVLDFVDSIIGDSEFLDDMLKMKDTVESAERERAEKKEHVKRPEKKKRAKH